MAALGGQPSIQIVASAQFAFARPALCGTFLPYFGGRVCDTV